MPAFLPTGSLTGLAFLAAAAWLIRFMRRSSNRVATESDSVLDARYGTLTPEALLQLVHADVVPSFIVDLRNAEQVERRPAPESLKRTTGGFLHIPPSDIRRVFSRRASGEYHNRFPSTRFPRKEDLIVCVSDEAKDCRRAVQELESLGFDCSVYLKGGVEALASRPRATSDVAQSAAFKHISRHAVALLLGLTDIPSPVEATVLDLRRMDELVIFGSIQGTKQLTVNELPKALTLDSDSFLERYQFDKPGLNDAVITSCRTNKRATWAAQLLTEAGYTKIFVHHTGSYGWRFSPSVKPYDSYNLGEDIPPPKDFSREFPDASAGLKELEDLGLISLGKNDVSARSSLQMTGDLERVSSLEDSAFFQSTEQGGSELNGNDVGRMPQL